MTLYFFDVHDGTMQFDEEGTECATLDEACRAAKRLLPDMARDQVARDGDPHNLAVLVSDESHRPVYTATLAFTEFLLDRSPR